jgi:uncharacterized repeat protein (TIGR01451 family)
LKKYILLLFIFCLQLVPAKAQWVTIPDANFAAKLQQLYPSCMNGNQMDTTCALIVNATTLNVNNSNISDLTGVEYFMNLTTLRCDSNSLSALPSLPNALVYLTCSYNQLLTLPPLPGSLLDFNCSFNQLIDLPALPSLMNYYDISNNNIHCLTNLPELSFPIPPPIDAIVANNPFTCIPNPVWWLSLPLCIDNDSINNPDNCLSQMNIAGYAFDDLIPNCNYDLYDYGANNIPVKLYDSLNNLIGQNFTLNGFYGFSITQTGNYKVKLEHQFLPFTMDCSQPDSQIVNLTSPSGLLPLVNFPVQCTQNSDCDIHSITPVGMVFPGQIHSLKTVLVDNINWFNLNCNLPNYSVNVSIEINGPVTYITPGDNALTPTISGNTFSYNIADFNSITSQSFGLKFQTDTTAQANDQICVHVEIDPTPIDADTTNNVYDFCYQVFNSYDPNMKEVYPVNVLPGYDDWFTYTIHFQNTGNAPAFNIRLRDTLDTNLDINTFEIRGYSHPAIVSINGNVLTVRFNNIMLPDSTTDYEGSMGYFQYLIKPLPNLPLGTQIENTAYIYFDYNAPIITNTTQNNFQTVVTTINRNEDTNQLKVFPNPANEVLNINLQNNIIENCIITNALGQTVYNSANEINANHKIQLNIADLNAGVYFVKVRFSNGSYTAKFIKSE